MNAEISDGVKTLSPSRTRITLVLVGSMRNGKNLQLVFDVFGRSVPSDRFTE